MVAQGPRSGLVGPRKGSASPAVRAWRVGAPGMARSERPSAQGRAGSIGRRGEIAQLVEHTTENRGVPSSSLGLAISKDACTWSGFEKRTRRFDEAWERLFFAP